jgi:hypothetical protein
MGFLCPGVFFLQVFAFEPFHQPFRDFLTAFVKKPKTGFTISKVFSILFIPYKPKAATIVRHTTNKMVAPKQSSFLNINNS